MVDGRTVEALCVDAACSGNPGWMEYRGVHIPSGKEIFRFGPVYGTNNIGEFLAIVHDLALLKKKGVNLLTAILHEHGSEPNDVARRWSVMSKQQSFIRLSKEQRSGCSPTPILIG